MTKHFNPKRKVANQGVAYVQRIADEMDCVWRPTPNDDVGLDGEIELGKDGAATARTCESPSEVRFVLHSESNRHGL
jgi:hypothetical protein